MRCIRIGCRLHEAAARYQYEGWTQMFVALVGTDTQYMIDMLEEMFGEGPLVDPKELLTSKVKAKFESACEAEKEAAKVEGEMDPSSTVTVIKAKSLPVASDFGINPELYLKSYAVPGISSTTGKEVNKILLQV